MIVGKSCDNHVTHVTAPDGLSHDGAKNHVTAISLNQTPETAESTRVLSHGEMAIM